MPVDGNRGYTPFEDSMIRKLYPIVGDEQLAKALNRPIGGVYARRVKLKVRSRNRKIVPNDLIEKVEIMLLDQLSMAYIASITDGVNEYNVMVIRDNMFERINRGKPKYIVPKKSFVCVGHKKTFYWKDEEQIMASFDPKYDANDLLDWEKETLDSTIKSEFKLQLL